MLVVVRTKTIAYTIGKYKWQQLLVCDQYLGKQIKNQMVNPSNDDLEGFVFTTHIVLD